MFNTPPAWTLLRKEPAGHVSDALWKLLYYIALAVGRNSGVENKLHGGHSLCPVRV
jgi:hypothetical protein